MRLERICPTIGILLLVLGVCPGALAGERLHSLDHGGERHFRVFLPSSLEPEARPALVLVFHGGGGSVDGIVRMTAMDGTAEREGFIAVYPAGTGPLEDRLLTWNAGACCGQAARNDVDDVGFVSKLIDFMLERYHVDPSRVYATGHSNGAQFSYRLACELSRRIAAIAPNAGQPVLEACKPARPVPVLHLHGTDDRCATWEGGECGGCFQDFLQSLKLNVEQKRWQCDPVEASVKAWAGRNGCSDATRVSLERGAVTCRGWEGCPAGAEVTLCRIQDGGHTWPGGSYAPGICNRPQGRLCSQWKAIVGSVNRDISANDMMWEFFQKHSLKRR